MAARTARAFTLIDLITVIVVIAVTSALTIPLWGDIRQKRRLVAATEAVHAHLALARSESLKRSRWTYASFSADRTREWAFGVGDSPDCDPAARPSRCTLSYPTADGVRLSAERVVRSPAFPGVRMERPTFAGGRASFNPIRGTANAGTVRLRTRDYEVRVVLSPLARLRVCSPDLGRYPRC